MSKAYLYSEQKHAFTDLISGQIQWWILSKVIFQCQTMKKEAIWKLYNLIKDIW